jgi:Protein of unknown function (DUF3455)
MHTHLTLGTAALALGLAACSGMPTTSMKIDNAALPEAVRVPAGESQKMWTTTDAGQITYECRDKKDMAGQYEWVFVGPVARLKDGSGKDVGSYFGPPATWVSSDGSRVVGKQVAVAPNAGTPGSIPLQLVKADPATGSGVMQGVSYIQRLKTVGGVAPALPCAEANKGEKKVVSYAADYVFYGR